MKVCVAGAAGAFGMKHLEALDAIDGVTVTSVVGGVPDDIEGYAKERDIGHWTRPGTWTKAWLVTTSTRSF